LVLPSDFIGWARQIFIFGHFNAPIRLSPPTWSLNVELYFYLLIGLITHRSERLTYAAFGISCLLGIWAAFDHAPFSFYADPLGNAFVFFLGSAACFLARRFTPPAWLGWAMLAVYADLAIFQSRHHITYSPGCNFVLGCSAVALAVMLIRPPHVSLANPGWLNFLGRLAYPLFLVHWAATTPLAPYLGEQGPKLFFASLAISLAVSTLMVLAIDRPIEHIRRRVRKAGAARLGAGDPVG